MFSRLKKSKLAGINTPATVSNGVKKSPAKNATGGPKVDGLKRGRKPKGTDGKPNGDLTSPEAFAKACIDDDPQGSGKGTDHDDLASGVDNDEKVKKEISDGDEDGARDGQENEFTPINGSGASQDEV